METFDISMLLAKIGKRRKQVTARYNFWDESASSQITNFIQLQYIDMIRLDSTHAEQTK